MKFLFSVVVVSAVFSLTASAANISISKKCLEASNVNQHLKNTLASIQDNVNNFDPSDNSRGYSLETGNLLVQMACLAVDNADRSPREQASICEDIQSNVKAYNENPAQGYSLETAKILNSMAGGGCL